MYLLIGFGISILLCNFYLLASSTDFLSISDLPCQILMAIENTPYFFLFFIVYQHYRLQSLGLDHPAFSTQKNKSKITVDAMKIWIYIYA